MSFPEASMQADYNVPPTAKDGTAAGNKDRSEMLYHEQQVFVVGVAAAIVDITQDSVSAGNPNYLRNGCYIVLEARDADFYVRFRPDNGVAGTTPGATTNGLKIPSGTTVRRWLPGLAYRYMDVISGTAASHIGVQRSSAKRGDASAPGQPGA